MEREKVGGGYPPGKGLSSSPLSPTSPSQVSAHASPNPNPSSLSGASHKPLLLDDVEDVVARLVHDQTRHLKQAKASFEHERLEFHHRTTATPKPLDLKKVRLNVGGKVYVTSLSTLTKLEDSTLAIMFSGRFDIEPDADGEFFIDRNGKLFGYILDYIRNGDIDMPEDDIILRKQLLREAQFFNIPPLVSLLSAHRDPAELDWTLDSSYCSSHIVISNNGLTAMNIGEGHAYVIGTRGWDKGKHAWKCEVSLPTKPHWILLGVSKQKRHKDNSYSDQGLWGLSSCNQVYLDGVVSTVTTSIRHGDSVYILLDCDKGSLMFYNEASGWRDEITGLPKGAHVPHFNIYDKCTGFTVTPSHIADCSQYFTNGPTPQKQRQNPATPTTGLRKKSATFSSS